MGITRRIRSLLDRLDDKQSPHVGPKDFRLPTKLQSLHRLKELNVPVGSVLDVGVLTCTYELIEAFPDKPHLLMEPIKEFEPRIRKIYNEHNIDIDYVQAAISDSDGEIGMQTNSVRDDIEITHARMDKSAKSKDRIVPMRRLDTLLSERQLPKPYLLKIDVDGAELNVLKGAGDALADCSIICIEAGLKTFLERAQFVIAAGFQAFDIVDLCYYDRRLVQTDMLFINNDIVKKMNLEVYRDGFDLTKWTQYDPWDLVRYYRDRQKDADGS